LNKNVLGEITRQIDDVDQLIKDNYAKNATQKTPFFRDFLEFFHFLEHFLGNFRV